MKNLSVVEEMLDELEQNKVFKKRLEIRLRFETNHLKRHKFKEDLKEVHCALLVVNDLLEYEYTHGISTHRLLKDIQR